MSKNEVGLYKPTVDPYEDSSYNGNESLKKGEVVAAVTREDFEYYTREIIRCRNDIEYFADNYFMTTNGETGRFGKINMYPKQREMLRLINEKNRIVNSIGRQSGKTTTYNIKILHSLCFEPDKKLGIIAQNDLVAKDILDRIKEAFIQLPKWIKPGVVKMNAKEIKLASGARCLARPATPDGARGLVCQDLYCDEFAFIDKAHEKEIWKTLYPTVTSFKENKIVIVSTPNGIGNLFYKFFQSGLANRKGDPDLWNAFTYSWKDVPGRDEAWKKKTIATMCEGDPDAFEQEFDCSFLGGGTTLIKLSYIEKQKQAIESRREKLIANSKIMDIAGNKINIFFDPIPGHCYSLGVDIGEGSGGDFTVLTMMDITNPLIPVQVAGCCSSTFPLHTVAYTATYLAITYNCAVIMPENNGLGKGPCNQIKSVYEYFNIVKVGSKMPGIASNNQVKTEACMFFRSLIESAKANLIIHSEALFDELATFERVSLNKGFTYKSNGGHDDNVMANIWALYILKEKLLSKFYEYEIKHINLIPFPIRIQQFLSETEMKTEQDYYFKILEEFGSSIGTTAEDEINTINESRDGPDHDYGFGIFR